MKRIILTLLGVRGWGLGISLGWTRRSIQAIPQPLTPIPFFLALLLFSSCEQVIEIDLPEHTPQLVVNSTFSPDSVVYVALSASKHLQDTAYLHTVDNGTVLVYEDGVLWDSLAFVPSNGFDLPHYLSSRYPVAGRTYRVQASAPGFTTVQGDDCIPMPVPILGLSVRDSVPGNNPGQPYRELSLTFEDPAGEGDRYVIGVYFQDSVETDPGQYEYLNFPIQSESADPNLEYDYNSSTFTLADNTFDGRQTTIKIRATRAEISGGGKIYVVLGTVSDHYFRYQRTLAKYLETAFNPFAEPVIVHSNMTPKMGIFAGYSMSRILIPQ